jgi:hypothetical protein
VGVSEQNERNGMDSLDVLPRHRRVFRKWWKALSYSEKVRFKECMFTIDPVEKLQISSEYQWRQDRLKKDKGIAKRAVNNG